ncbi:signal peptidase I, partial [Bacillus sp. HC-Mk]
SFHLYPTTVDPYGNLTKDTVNELKEGYLDHTLLEEYKQLNYPETKIPSRKVFVMGDNRLNSRDSRTGLGDIDVSSIVGKAEFVFYPFNRAQVID